MAYFVLPFHALTMEEDTDKHYKHGLNQLFGYGMDHINVRFRDFSVKRGRGSHFWPSCPVEMLSNPLYNNPQYFKLQDINLIHSMTFQVAKKRDIHSQVTPALRGVHKRTIVLIGCVTGGGIKF